MATINRRPAAVRRAAYQQEAPQQEAPQQFNPNFNDIGEGDAWGPNPMGEPYLAQDPAFGHDPMSKGPTPFMDPFDPRSPGFGERMMDPSFVKDFKSPGGPTSFGPGGGVPSGGPDTGIAKIMAASKPGALGPMVIPSGVSGVKTSTMRGPGGGGYFGGPFGSLGGSYTPGHDPRFF